ncbi:MAG TPA: TonB-dependent receptor plug domain-containing protein [Gemmatimonadales bacterium]
MSTAHAHRLIGLLLCGVAACSHRGGKSEDVAPSSANPHSVMTEEEIDRAPGRSIGQLIMDRFPSVTVSETPDGGLRFHIRGVGSFMASSQPLCLVDDEPIDLSRGSNVRAINPHDIASIEVVQDPAGTAMYGVRGANGVIVIRTKRPGQ